MRGWLYDLLASMILSLGRLRCWLFKLEGGRGAFKPDVIDLPLLETQDAKIKWNYLVCPLCRQRYVVFGEDGKVSLFLIGPEEEVRDEVSGKL